jgi:hypothetical protein
MWTLLPPTKKAKASAEALLNQIVADTSKFSVPNAVVFSISWHFRGGHFWLSRQILGISTTEW